MDKTPILDLEQSLRERVASLEYKLLFLKDEKELQKLQHEQSLRELEARVKSEGLRADKAESDKTFLFQRQESLSSDIDTLKTELDEYQSNAEENIKNLRSQVSQYQDKNLELKSENDKLRRTSLKNSHETEYKLEIELQKNQELEKQLEKVISELNASRTKELELQQEVSQFKDQSKRFKNFEADQKQSDLLQKQLGEQLDYIGRLEKDVENKQTKIKQLEGDRKLIAILEDEKERLKKKLEINEGLQAKLVDCEMKLADLESAKSKWEAFLQKDSTFNSPEALSRELMVQKETNANLTEQVSRIASELKSNGPDMEHMREQIDKLDAQLEETKGQLSKEKDTRIRLQKLNELAITESTFLRGQIKSYEAEEEALIQKKFGNQEQANPSPDSDLAESKPDESDLNKNEDLNFENSNKLKAERIQMLEELVKKYQNEIGDMTKEFENREVIQPDTPASSDVYSPLKRQITPFSSGERVSELTRKVRTLQVELDQAQVTLKTQQKDLLAAKTQLQFLEKEKSLQKEKTNGVRILELKDNPLARHEKVKQTMIVALKQENQDLLRQLTEQKSVTGEEEDKPRLVPYSTIERYEAEATQLNQTINDQTKRMERLKQVFSKKSLEFREAVYSLLGYRVDLLPSKKIRATSIFSNDEDESFIFTPDSKSLKESTTTGSSFVKFTSIEDGPLTREYENLVTFWIKERKDIPCFLSAVNLELYDKTTNATKFLQKT